MPPTDHATPLFDRNTVLARIGGNALLLKELVDMFLEDCPRWMVDIQAAIRQGDAPGVKFTAHLLRGSVGNFGTPPAYEAARKLEMMARAYDLTGAEDAYLDLESAIRQLRGTLAEFVVQPVS